METITEFEINVDKVNQLLHSNRWEQMISEGCTAQKMLDISDKVLQRYYAAAEQLLQEQNWIEAKNAFSFLTFLNPCMHHFWVGLGIAEQAQGHFHEAVQAYIMGTVTNAEDPVVHANAFQCYSALKQEGHALESFYKAIECCSDKPEFAAIRTKTMQYKRQLDLMPK